MNHQAVSKETFQLPRQAFFFIIGLIGVGALSLILTYVLEPAEFKHARFWTNILHNTVFFVGIAFSALLFMATHTLAWGGWQTVFKRIPEAMMMFLPIGILLIAIMAIAVFSGSTDMLYIWSREGIEKTDHLIAHKQPFLNPTVYALTVAVVALWALFAWWMRKDSIAQDSSDKEKSEKLLYRKRVYAAIFLPVAGFSSAFAIWQWIMSVDPHWYSTLFAWYVTASVFVSAVSIMTLIALYLRSLGYLKLFSKDHLHDLGKYIFGFSVFWTYLWFSQFMLIWYANNGEETQYFFLRMEQFEVLFYGNLIINFLAPFFILMANNSKRTFGTVGFVAGLVIFGHWIDVYQMIKPGVWYNYEHDLHAAHDGHGDHHGDDHGHDAKGHEEHGDVYRSDALDYNQAPKAVLTSGQAGDEQAAPETEQGDATHAEGEHAGDEHAGEGHADEAHAGDNHAEGAHAGEGHADEAHAGDDHAAGHTGDEAHAAHAEGHDGHAAHAEEHSLVMGIHLPGVLEVGGLAFFLGLFLLVTFTYLQRASLYAVNDPFMAESQGHETGVYDDAYHEKHH